MTELRKPLFGLMAALIALFGAIALNANVESARNASLTEAAAPPPPA